MTCDRCTEQHEGEVWVTCSYGCEHWQCRDAAAWTDRERAEERWFA